MSGTLVVDINEIKKNILSIKKQTGVKFCAVVKANAYGVGIGLVKHISSQVDYFAVANVHEANTLAKFSKKPILVLSPPTIADINQIRFKNIEFAVDDINIIKKLKNSSKKYKIHIAINSGMNRYGTNYDEFLKIVENVKTSENICMRGVFSHFFDNTKDNMKKQYDIAKKFFDYAGKNFKNIICHISNSGGTVYPEDMVRIGIGLYVTSTGSSNALTLFSNIAKINQINAGEIVSYNAHYVADRQKKIAVVPLGYADGISRKASGFCVCVNNVMCKIVGDICMDCFMVDVTNAHAKVGDRVIIFGKTGKCNNSVCNLAKWCDTICYEILTGMSCRIQRKYYANYHRKI